jgi:1,2-diacylglycerol 3-alpha-glucosyltransferase
VRTARIQPVRVLIACPGLGLEMRGFERAAREWFDALRTSPDLDVWLVKGHGRPADRELRAATVPRSAWVSRAAGRALGRRDFWLEEVLFAATLQRSLARLDPEVVMLSELSLAAGVGRLRRLTRRQFRILLSNGAPARPPFPYGVDHVQQLTPFVAELALEAGMAPERQTVLPYALSIPDRLDPPSAAARAELRRGLRLPIDRTILLSAGAINAGHKRMDYLVREVAALGEGRPFLLLLGARDAETPAVLKLAEELLGPEGFTARTVPLHEMAGYYRVADAFALASLIEGFGLVYAEALAHGLPVLAHDFPTARFVLAGLGKLGDLTRPGALAEQFAELGEADSVERRGRERHQSVHERFSWSALLPRYVEMIRRVTEDSMPGG